MRSRLARAVCPRRCAGARRVYVRSLAPPTGEGAEGRARGDPRRVRGRARASCGGHNPSPARTVGALLDEPTFAAPPARLCDADPALAAIVERHGLPAFWAREPGLETLVLLILEQQVSLASARAAGGRLETRPGGLSR